MRRVIMWNMVTLDGYFEGASPWDIDWHGRAWGDELEQLSLEQLRSADALLFGRATYTGMASFWPSETGSVADMMNSIPKIVFSRTLDNASWNNTRLVSTDAADEVARLKNEPGNDLYIFGSADLASTLTEKGLIDEYRIGLVPILLGGGNPLFKPMPHNVPLTLLEARALKSGGVILRYEPERL
jgi:dihydrofolate reductase